MTPQADAEWRPRVDELPRGCFADFAGEVIFSLLGAGIWGLSHVLGWGDWGGWLITLLLVGGVIGIAVYACRRSKR